MSHLPRSVSKNDDIAHSARNLEEILRSHRVVTSGYKSHNATFKNVSDHLIPDGTEGSHSKVDRSMSLLD